MRAYLQSSIIAGMLISAVLTTGCAVGPDFRQPAAPETAAYTAGPGPEKTVAAPVYGGEEQRFAPEQDIPGKWWELYHSKALDEVIRKALKNSPTLASAKAALQESREYLTAGRGTYYPQVNADVSALRQKTSGAASRQSNANTSPYNLYNASVGVSYTLDIFGGMRRELEGLEAQVDYQKFLLEGSYLALTSNIVTAAVLEASLRAQIKATKDIIEAQEKQLDVVERQFQLGAVPRADLLVQKTLLAQTTATLPAFEKQLDQTRHRLAVLAGQLPGNSDLPVFSLEELNLPKDLPVSLPSQLVRQRPDIRASESLLHAASAQVGVATANLYPQITLSGSYGTQAISSGDLFGAYSAFWSLGAGLLQPVFRGGELTAMRRAAIAAYDSSEARYRETVLLAFEDVANVLRALEADAQILKSQAAAEAAAAETLDIAQKQFRLGAVSYLTMLVAQRQYQVARISLVQAQAARFADSAALFEALGGGWWNRTQEETSRTAEGK